MKKFNTQTVFDYINGNDIDGFDLEELENNSEFMKKVLSVSKDKKMYYLCGDELLDDVEFLKYVVELFSKDEDYVCEIIKSFLNRNTDNEKNKFEAALVGLKYSKDRFDIIKYKTLANVLYECSKIDIENAIEKEASDKSLFGMGFIVVRDIYAGKDLTINFFAEKFIDEAFDHMDSLENYLHESFKSKEELSEYGVVKFIIDYVKFYDRELANYIALNPKIVKDYKKSIERVMKNWNFFEECNKINKYEEINSKIIDYFMDGDVTISRDIDLFVYYILHSRGIDREFNKYIYDIDEEHLNSIIKAIQNKEISFENLNINDRIHAIKIGEIIDSVMKQRVFQVEDEYVKQNKKDCIVLKLNNKMN